MYQKMLTAKGESPYAINAITYVLLCVVCLPFLLFFGFTKETAAFWEYSVLMGFLGAVGNSFLIKAFKDGPLSVLAPINAYKAILGLIFAAIFLKEIPNLFGITGIILILFGSYFVLGTLKEGFTPALFKNKQLQYRFLALLFCSLEAVVIKKVILLSSIWTAFVTWCLFGAIFSLILLKICRIDIHKEVEDIKSRDISFFINIVVCVGIMQFTTNYVLKNMNVGYALALFQLSAILSVFLGAKVFKEKHIVKKLIGAFIMVAGAVIIILYN